MRRLPWNIASLGTSNQPYGATATVLVAAIYAPGTLMERAILVVAVTPILAYMIFSARA